MNRPPDFGQTKKEDIPPLCIQTLGSFRVWHEGEEISSTAWKREKALHLFQFFITMRRQTAHLHKEQIIDRLWPDIDIEDGDRDFKVALHTINKVVEPGRKPRTDPRFIQRHGLTYGLVPELIWIDADAFEDFIAKGNQAVLENREEEAITLYQKSLDLYQGDYLPERRYEDWSSAERERIQVLALGIMTALAELLLTRNPLESIRLTQRVLAIDPVWENAYRTQMQAYVAQGNRPLAIRTYQRCVEALSDELDVDPLPETQALFRQINQ